MREKLLFLIVNLFLIFILSCNDETICPVNPNATSETRQLLSFLYSIHNEYTLSGQHHFISDLKRYEHAFQSVTGKTPVVWGSDFSFNIYGDSVHKHQHCGPLNLTVPFDSCQFHGISSDELRMAMINEAINKYNQGRIIILMWHCCFPSQGDLCQGEQIWTGDNKISDNDWEELVTEGTPLNQMWKSQVDNIVFYLSILQENKVPVLWRPYHEMNGGWFWWGGRPGEDGYKKLWVMMYEYFTNHHQLNNLLWVWNANAIGPWVPDYDEFYPGNEYVDILATDVYRQEYTWETYAELVKLGKGKLVALGEIGEVPTLEQFQMQPYSWYMIWGYYTDQYNTSEDVNAIVEHPRTLTLDKIDFKNKKYAVKSNLKQ